MKRICLGITMISLLIICTVGLNTQFDTFASLSEKRFVSQPSLALGLQPAATPTPSPDDSGEASSPIVPGIGSGSGVLVLTTTNQLEAVGVIKLDVPVKERMYFCSSVLLTNNWVLTAGHCITNAIMITAEAPVSQEKLNPVSIYYFGGYKDPSGPDLALLYFSTGFQIQGSRSGYHNELFCRFTTVVGASCNPQSLIGKKVFMLGQGVNDISTDPPNYDGQWRAALAPITAFGAPGVSATVYRIGGSANSSQPNGSPTSTNAVIAPGDSGGPDFFVINGVRFITGIHSGASMECKDRTTEDSCKASITKIHYGFSTAIPAYFEWIHAVLQTHWSSLAVAQPIAVYGGEISAAAPKFTNLASATSADASRTAHAMCARRGFISGFLTGYTISQGAAILQCAGFDYSQGTSPAPATVFTTTVTAKNIAATGWPFTNIDTAPWALAGRAAHELCTSLGYVGGRFTGYGDRTKDEYHLACYSNLVAAYHIAAAADVVSAGFAATDVNTISWDQATRAATAYCNALYKRPQADMSGFMTGHQEPGVFGVICVGTLVQRG